MGRGSRGVVGAGVGRGCRSGVPGVVGASVGRVGLVGAGAEVPGVEMYAVIQMCTNLLAE